jgi:hypothetical protein
MMAGRWVYVEDPPEETHYMVTLGGGEILVRVLDGKDEDEVRRRALETLEQVATDYEGVYISGMTVQSVRVMTDDD